MRQIPLLHSSRTFRCMAAFILPGKEQMQVRKIPMSLYKLEPVGSFRDVLHRDLFFNMSNITENLVEIIYMILL